MVSQWRALIAGLFVEIIQKLHWALCWIICKDELQDFKILKYKDALFCVMPNMPFTFYTDVLWPLMSFDKIVHVIGVASQLSMSVLVVDLLYWNILHLLQCTDTNLRHMAIGVHCRNVAARVPHELSPSSSFIPKSAQAQVWWGGADLAKGAFSGYSGWDRELYHPCTTRMVLICLMEVNSGSAMRVLVRRSMAGRWKTMVKMVGPVQTCPKCVRTGTRGLRLTQLCSH